MIKKKKLRQKSHALNATVNIGREGLTPGNVEHLKKQLVQKKLIKVRISPAVFGDGKKSDFAQILAASVNATIVHRVGFVVVLSKR